MFVVGCAAGCCNLVVVEAVDVTGGGGGHSAPEISDREISTGKEGQGGEIGK